MAFPISGQWSIDTEHLYISHRFRDICIFLHLGHDLDLSRSRDVIGHVSIRFHIWHFILVVNWYWASISHRFRDICIYLYLGHDLDLLGSHDVIGHV